MIRHRRTVRQLLAAAALVAAPLAAQTPPVAAELLAEPGPLRAGQPVGVAVRLVVQPGWYIYWTDPGEFGRPTTVQWSLPDGFTITPITWPAPERLTDSTGTTLGMRGQVLLLASVTPPPGYRPGRRATIRADVAWAACSDVCVPGRATLSLTLPTVSTGSVNTEGERRALDAVRAQRSRAASQ